MTLWYKQMTNDRDKALTEYLLFLMHRKSVRWNSGRLQNSGSLALTFQLDSGKESRAEMRPYWTQTVPVPQDWAAEYPQWRHVVLHRPSVQLTHQCSGPQGQGQGLLDSSPHSGPTHRPSRRHYRAPLHRLAPGNPGSPLVFDSSWSVRLVLKRRGGTREPWGKQRMKNKASQTHRWSGHTRPRDPNTRKTNYPLPWLLLDLSHVKGPIPDSNPIHFFEFSELLLMVFQLCVLWAFSKELPFVWTESWLCKWEANVVAQTELLTIPTNQHSASGVQTGCHFISCWDQTLTTFHQNRRH